MSTVGLETRTSRPRSSNFIGTLKRFFKAPHRSEEGARVGGAGVPGETPANLSHCRAPQSERCSLDTQTCQDLGASEAFASPFTSRKSADRSLDRQFFASNSGPLVSMIHRFTAQAPLHHSISDTCESPFVQVNLQRQQADDANWPCEQHKQLHGRRVRGAALKLTVHSDASLPSLSRGASRSSSLDIQSTAISSPVAVATRPAVPVSLPSVEPTSQARMSASQYVQHLTHQSTETPAAESNAIPPNTILLAFCQGAPAAMRRRNWCLQDYEVIRRLYKGSSSAVYKATCRRSGLPVALKVYSLSRVPANVVHMIVREIKIHVELVHKHIVMLYGAFQDEKRLVLVQEYAGRGDLYGIYRSLNHRMTEAQLTHLVLAPFMDALSYLHSRGICHRDIKPENILFTNDWRLLLADFGVSIDLNQERAVTRAGTLEYMAPEVERCPLKMLPEENKEKMDLAYTTAVDIWATGVLAYELLVGFAPFVVDRAAAAEPAGGGTFLSQHANQRTLSFPSSTSPHARDFISLALAEAPEDRPTSLQLSRHPWLGSVMQQRPSGTTTSPLALRAVAVGQLGTTFNVTPLYPSRLGSASLASGPSSGAVPVLAGEL